MEPTLPEELLLIAYNRTTGRATIGSTELGCGLSGAVLAELGRPEWWVDKLQHELRNRLLLVLTERGVLRLERRKVLWVSGTAIPGERDRHRNGCPGMVSLMNACGLVRHNFPGLDRRRLKARMRELDEGQWPSAAVRRAIQSNQASAASG